MRRVAWRDREARPVIGERTMRWLIALARRVPLRWGYGLAEAIGRLAAWLFPKRRAILESNLAAVLGAGERRRLRRMATEIFAHALRSYYELLRLPALPLEEVLCRVVFEEPGWTQFREAYRQGKGVIVVGPHQSSFDLAGYTVIAQGFPLCVFTLPDEAGFGSLNELRALSGARVLPAGPAAVREALRALRRGEVVVLAADRPTRGQGTVVEFFGRPTLLPDGHVRLALHTGAPVFLAFVHREGERYRVRFQPLEIIRTGNEAEDVRRNVQRTAQATEPGIRAHPEQWHLFLRLWEEEPRGD